MKTIGLVGLIFCFVLPHRLVWSDTAGMENVGLHTEADLISAIDDFRNGNMAMATSTLQSLLREVPNYRLAHLVYGDLMAVSAGRPLSFESESPLPPDSTSRLWTEVRQRYLGGSFNPGNKVPAALLQLDPEQTHAIVIDLSRSRLFLFRQTGQSVELEKDYYVSMGKNGPRKQAEGDGRTPLGVYTITHRLPGSRLPDKYGPAAFPMDYPNDWDRLQGRTGSGIWLHGMPSKNFSRPPRDSDGCVALTNAELLDLAPRLAPGVTPVVIGHKLEWVTQATLVNRRQELLDSLDAWRRTVNEQRIDDLLAFYDRKDFPSGLEDGEWEAPTLNRTVDAAENAISLSNVSLLAHPQEQNLVLVRFDQTYHGLGSSSKMPRRQYWRKNDARQWRIVFEGS